jgi:hypothetical protein
MFFRNLCNSTKLHGVRTHKIKTFIASAVRKQKTQFPGIESKAPFWKTKKCKIG